MESVSRTSRTMSNSSTCSVDSSKKSLAKLSKASNNSTRSSVSSMTSTSSFCSNSLGNSYGSPNNNINHALAMVTNQLEREQRKHDQEATRKLTLLRQRKISAVLKVNIDFSEITRETGWFLMWYSFKEFCFIIEATQYFTLLKIEFVFFWGY